MNTTQRTALLEVVVLCSGSSARTLINFWNESYTSTPDQLLSQYHQAVALFESTAPYFESI